MGEITLHVAQTVNTEQLQHYTHHRNMVCFRYIIINNLHKSDKKDINNNIL